MHHKDQFWAQYEFSMFLISNNHNVLCFNVSLIKCLFPFYYYFLTLTKMLPNNMVTKANASFHPKSACNVKRFLRFSISFHSDL